MNSYLFIIPATPKKYMNGVRVQLQNLCVGHLIKQNYSNWKALWISEDAPRVNDERFIHVNYEGGKEEKLQVASQYIIENNIKGDYIIRLDDDDVFNTQILSQIKDKDFDLMVDKHQAFWLFDSPYFASRVWYWFPNTCIHKRENALAVFGKLASDAIKRLNTEVRLIENDHSKLHSFYANKHVVFSGKDNPIYIRTITDSSITSMNSEDQDAYLLNFGYWKKKKYTNFSGLSGNKILPIKQPFKHKVNCIKNNQNALRNYSKVLNLT